MKNYSLKEIMNNKCELSKCDYNGMLNIYNNLNIKLDNSEIENILSFINCRL